MHSTKKEHFLSPWFCAFYVDIQAKSSTRILILKYSLQRFLTTLLRKCWSLEAHKQDVVDQLLQEHDCERRFANSFFEKLIATFEHALNL